MAHQPSGRRVGTEVWFALLIAFLTGFGTTFGAEVFVPSAVPEELLYQEQRPGFTVGPLDLYPRATAGTLYDDNIFLSDIFKTSDVIWQVAPGLYTTYGDLTNRLSPFLTLDYSPTFLFFTDHTTFDTVNHIARLAGGLPFSKLTLGLSQDYIRTQTAVVGAGASLFTLQDFNTILTAHYEMGEKTSFDVNGRQTFYDWDDPRLIGSREWVNDDWFNYQLASKVSTGVGVSFGYLDVPRYPSQLYQRLSVRAIYQLTGKLDLHAAAGGERREYGHGEPDSYTPVFSIGGTYRPTDRTTITLDAYRRELPSSWIAGYNYLDTGFSLSVRQIIYQRFALSVGGGYETLEYRATSAASSGIDLTYDSYFIRPGLDYAFTPHWRAGAFYQYRRNASNQRFYDYTDDQVGLQVSWLF